MARKGKGKNRKPIVPSGNDEPGEDSTDWETCTEEQLEKITRKKLDDACRKALSVLLFVVSDEDLALKGLLARGYCSGKDDCCNNVFVNSFDFLFRHNIDSEKEEDEPQPFQTLELLVEFNLQFMVYILQKYRPELNRISAFRCILMNDLNLNRAILMGINETLFVVTERLSNLNRAILMGVNDAPFIMTEMLSNLNLDDYKENQPEHDDSVEFDHDDLVVGGDNVVKDRFLALEIRQVLYNLDVLDESVSELMKDMMIANSQKTIDALDGKLKDRIRWATKRVAPARRKQTAPIMNLREEIQLFQKYTELMLYKKSCELSSVDRELDNADKAIKDLEIEKVEIKAEMLELETWKNCLKFSNCDKKVKLQEAIAMEKKQKVAKWEQKLDEIEATLTQAELKFGKVRKAREVAIAQFEEGKRLGLERWANLKPLVDALKNQTISESFNIFKDDILKLDKTQAK